ncbi:hypothetical protein GQ457_11G003150 [Hibiscus cannabinus]
MTEVQYVDIRSGSFLDVARGENRYIAAQLVAFLRQTPQYFTTSMAFSRKTPLVNVSGVFAPNAARFRRFFEQTPQLVTFSGVFAPNAAIFYVRMQFIETASFRADRRSPVARRRPPAAVRPSPGTARLHEPKR